MRKLLIVVIVLLVILIAAVMLNGCTKQGRAFYTGGKMSLDLPVGKKLVMVSWKDGDLWYLVRPYREGETPETYTYAAKTAYGVWEGEVTLVEHK
jgi:hypothetical protein